MADNKADPFLDNEYRSNTGDTDDSLANYHAPAATESFEQLRSPQEYNFASLGNLDSPTTNPMFSWQPAPGSSGYGQQYYGSQQPGMPIAPSLSVEQFYTGPMKSDTGGSADFPMPNAGPVGLGLAPSNANYGARSVSNSSLQDSDEYSDFSSDHSGSPMLVRDASGNFLVLPSKNASDPSLMGSRSYENLAALGLGSEMHNTAGLLATTRAPSPHFIMMSSPAIRAIPSPNVSRSPSLSPGGSPSLTPLSASQISMFDLNRPARPKTQEQIVEEFLKMEDRSQYSTNLMPIQQPGRSADLKVPTKPRKREQSADPSEDGDRSPGQKSRQTLYGCPFEGCGKSFTRPYNLKSHYRSHTGERPYACGSCPLTFSRKHDLKRHEKLHTGAKPFSCIACHKSFARSDALTRHLKSEPGKESPCAQRINLMNAKEKMAEAQSIRDEQYYAQSQAFSMSDHSSPSEMSATSPQYPGMSPNMVYSVPPHQAGMNYTYQQVDQNQGQQAQFIQYQPHQGQQSQIPNPTYSQVIFVDPQLSYPNQQQPRARSPRR